MKRETLNRPQWVLLIAGLVFGTYLRVREVPGAFLFGDEFHSIRHLRLGFQALLTSFDVNGSGLALPLIQRLLVDALGFNNWSLRLPALLGSLGGLVMVYPAARLFVSTRAALVASLLVAVNSLDVFYGHFGRAYALASLLALWLLICCGRLYRSEVPHWRDVGGIAVSLALLPWVHLAALGSAIAVLAGSATQLAIDPLRRARLRILLLAVAVGVFGAALLQLPAIASTWEFVQIKTQYEQYYGSFGPGDVLVLIAGHWTMAIAISAFSVLGTALLLLGHHWRALPLVFAAGAPWIALWIMHPVGDAYAYARYLIPTVAPLLILAGHAIAELTSWLVPLRANVALTIITPLVTAIAFMLSPLGLTHTPEGPYANTYLGLLGLPAFDIAFPGMPDFYRQLAQTTDPITIVEAPALLNRSLHLYRNYYLRHQRRTLLGFFPEELDEVPTGPYVSAVNPEALRSTGADYLILHRDPVAEVARYWRFVYESWSNQSSAPGVRALMERHAAAFPSESIPKPSAALLSELLNAFGQPAYMDRDLLVWKLGTHHE